MNAVATQTQFTPEDLLNMSDGDRYELVDGHLVECAMSLWSSYVAGVIHALLYQFCRAHRSGWVLPEGTSYQCFPDAPARVRRADVSFIRLDRLPVTRATEEGHVRLAPDLAVEVVSPNDSAYDIDQKVQEFLQAGVCLVWVINPRLRLVRVYRADGSLSQLGEGDELPGEDVLPGFRCPVRELFSPPTADVPAEGAPGHSG